MAKIIPITQNPQRYTEQQSEWVVSASPNISPITIAKGIQISNLKPLLGVDGVVVKADEWYLCSPGTLAALEESRNPHYSIQTNGPISWGTASVDLGKTVKIIEVNVDNLKSQAEELDIKNRKAGVAFVDYIFEGEERDGVPVNLIKQIDYTLNPQAERPEDNWGVYELALGDDTEVYSIQTLNIDTRQEDGSLDRGKLETFLTNIGNRLKVLRGDFNTLKEIFYNGKVPDGVSTVTLTQQAQTVTEEDEFPVLFKYTELVSVVTPPPTTINTPTTGSNGITPTPSGNPTTGIPPVIELKMRKRRDLIANTIPVFENDPTIGSRGREVRKIREGERFWGYFLKDWEHGQKIWVVYESDKTTLIGYGVADRNDFVDTL